MRWEPSLQFGERAETARLDSEYVRSIGAVGDGRRQASPRAPAGRRPRASRVAGRSGRGAAHGAGAAYFIEGLGDTVPSLDADALAAMYLQSRNESTVARRMIAYADSAFAVSRRLDRQVHQPRDLTYNDTYAASGPFSGFKPYLGTAAPNVLRTDGSAEMLLAQESLGQPSTGLSQSLSAIAALTPTEAPVQANQVGRQHRIWR
jgi:hypothetical protein